jgi:hypothetical protein
MHVSQNEMMPLAITFSAARKISGLGLTTLWGLARERRIEIVRIGRRTLITYRSLARLLLPETTDMPQPRRRGRPRKLIEVHRRERTEPVAS